MHGCAWVFSKVADPLRVPILAMATFTQQQHAPVLLLMNAG